MNILHVNNIDIFGRRFNGFDLSIELQKRGITSNLYVNKKYSQNNISIQSHNPIKKKRIEFVHRTLNNLEAILGMDNMLQVFGRDLLSHDSYKKADIIHFHIIHNHVISLEDMLYIANEKKVVWTIHDMWAVTGNCIQPIYCDKWKNECYQCPNLDEAVLPMRVDKTKDMFKRKKAFFSEFKGDIVVASDYMKNNLLRSPMINENHRIHKIPFGLNFTSNSGFQEGLRDKYGIGSDEFVVGFRAEEYRIKGLKYIMEALKMIEFKVTIITVGNEKINIENHKVINLGQVRTEMMLEFYKLIDIFLMPSLGESFGLMAIEAMSMSVPTISFTGTAVEEVTAGPEIGISAKYGSSSDLARLLKYYNFNREELMYRGKRGEIYVKEQYSIEQYVDKHISVYDNILLDK